VKVQVPSRSVLIILLCIAPALLLLRDFLTDRIYWAKVNRGELRENIILAGEMAPMKKLKSSLPATTRKELNIVSQVDLAKQPIESLIEEMHRHPVSRVILCFENMKISRAQEAVNACEIEGVEVWLIAGFIQTSIARPTYENFNGHPTLVFRTTPEISWSLFIKEAMDRVLAFLALIALSPVFLMLAIAIKLTSPGPVFFKQVRSGLHGRRFRMVKFRSMVMDAEERRAALEEHNEMSGPVFKLTKDPRVTPLGNLMRRTSLDELPQFWNVLRGEMSLVGPRPLPDYEVAKFDQASHRRRLSMKPGLTCLWQVSGRSEVRDFSDWVRLDLEYIDNWSLGLDIVILLRTVPVVLFGKGAK
jgi:exopolysaccharide biosynthesis polyprenyl glycosylphosphotransferase